MLLATPRRWALGALACGVWTQPAQALELNVSLPCMQAEAFRAAVEARRVESAKPAGQKRYWVHAAPEQGQYRGQVRAVEAGQLTLSREVVGTHCESVAEALAVIVAVAENQALQRPAEAAPTPAAPQPTPAAPQPPRTQPQSTPPAKRQPTALRLGAAGELTGALDGLAPALLLSVELARPESKVFPFIEVLGRYHLPTRPETAEPFGLELDLLDAAIAVAPTQWQALDRFALVPRGRFELGQISGRAIGVEGPLTSRALWTAAGVSLAAQLRGPWWTLELHSGLALPLTRHQFYATLGDQRILLSEVAGPHATLGLRFQVDLLKR